MKAGHYIDFLAKDLAPQPKPPLALYFLAALVLLFIESLIVIGLGLGMRPDYFAAITSFPTMMKQITTLGLGVGVLTLIPLYFYPETGRTGVLWRIGLIAAAMAGMWLSAFAKVEPGNLGSAIMGETYLRCMSVVVLMSLPVLIVLLLGLRQGAVTRPSKTGFLTGLGVGGLAAFGYAFSCAEDNPLFYATWYSIAMLLPAVIGALIAPRILRY